MNYSKRSKATIDPYTPRLHYSYLLSSTRVLHTLALYIYTYVYACVRVCVSESLTLGARVAQCRVWTLWALCEARANEYARTMHQRVKTQWRTTQTPESRGQYGLTVNVLLYGCTL